MSKDLRQGRLGQNAATKRKRILIWAVVCSALAGGAYGAYRYTGTTKVEVPVSKVRQGDFIISVKSRGEVRSVNSVILQTPQIPDPRIVTLAESGKPVRKGQVIVEFDAASQEQFYLDRTTSVRTVDSEMVQLKASHRITDEMDGMNKMTATYNVDRAKLEASKAEILSDIDGKKSKIDVTTAEGDLGKVNVSISSHKTAQGADLQRLNQKKDKTLRDVDRAKSYLGKMKLYAPIDGIVNILPNTRTSGAFGSALPPFKEGDRVWTGASIAEIPDLSSMRVELKLDEVDRGKIQLGQELNVRVDAIPDAEFAAKIDWISPIAAVNFKGMGLTEKTFPVRGTLAKVDSRLRPGMSASVEIIIEKDAHQILIPVRASFVQKGKPSVFVQKGDKFESRVIEVGKRNDTDLVVLKGLKAGETIAMEDPAEVAKRARKL